MLALHLGVVYIDSMQTERIASRGPYLTVDRGRLDELRKAHGIDSDADLARVIGVDPATLYRVREGKTVASNEFLAKVAVAFPGASFDRLFTVVHPLAAAAREVA